MNTMAETYFDEIGAGFVFIFLLIPVSCQIVFSWIPQETVRLSLISPGRPAWS